VRVVWIGLVIVIGIAGCQPDYSATAFRCDATHGCPTGQSCEAGRCRRGGAVGEVACGAATCTTAEQCCVDPPNEPACIAAGDQCLGNGALCDGSEDCQLGDRCCVGPLNTCGAGCAETACLDDEDCPSTEPNCCLDVALPWKQCLRVPC
jgi:hypothetical protein